MRFLVVLVAIFAALVGATPSPKQQPPQTSTLNSIFGVSTRLPAMMSVRGGAVLEPKTLEDVESMLLKAGSEQKLVVIDFSASWQVTNGIVCVLRRGLSYLTKGAIIYLRDCA